MKRIISLFLAAILCLCLAGCGKHPNRARRNLIQKQRIQRAPMISSKATAPPGTRMGQSCRKNLCSRASNWSGRGIWTVKRMTLPAFADALDLFPGYGEWGASMEIRSDGQMSWYIGAEGWYGTYSVEDGVIHAQLTSNLEQSTRTWDFRITAENETAILEMDYQDMTIYWAHGDREEIPAMGMPESV